MTYTCRQEIIVLEDSETCDRAFEEHILEPALQFIGLDCEWNTNRPVSLLQVATPTTVLLVRVCKLNFMLPNNVKLVLEDPTIYKVGVNIENDSKKLREDCFCTIKSWVDLRHVAIRAPSWGRCIVEQVEDLEYNLKFFDQKDPNSESAKQANTKRLCWCPKMGLESLISDCLGAKLPKNTSARWSDDWESDRLQSNQKTYAANDATASLDIFVALVAASVTEQALPFDTGFDVAEYVDKYAKHLDNAVKELLDVVFMQTREDMDRIYRSIEATAPELDIKAYYTKSQPTKSQLNKKEKKEFYKKKAREAAVPPRNEAISQPNSFLIRKESDPLQSDKTDKTDSNQDLDTSGGSHTFREITQALAHTKPNSKTLTENFLTLQSDRDETYPGEDQSNHPPLFPILFYFKHITEKQCPLIPGYSYGRGSIPPPNYRRFRTKHLQTQTEFQFRESHFKKVYPSYKPLDISDFERNSYANTDYSYILRQPPVNKLIIPAERVESPVPNSTTTDSDQCSVSSCTSSNYKSCTSKGSKSKGRGRGRAKPAPSISSSRVDSDSEVKKGLGRGRGRGAPVPLTETRAPNSRPDTNSDSEKVVFNSYDIRYQNTEEDVDRPTALDLGDRSRKPTTSSVSSAATIRQISAVSETTPVQPPTPTNFLANARKTENQPNTASRIRNQEYSGNNAQEKAAFEQEFFETGPTYSTFSIQDLMADNEPDNQSARQPFTNRGYSASSRGTSHNNTHNTFRSGNAARQHSNPYSSKSTNTPDRINQQFTYNTDIFRQAIEREGNSLHVGVGPGASYKPPKEEVLYDWSKFREEHGIASASESSNNNTGKVVMECSDSDLDSSD